MKGSHDPIQLSQSLVSFSRPQDFLYAGLLAGISSRSTLHSWGRTFLVITLLFSLYTLAVIYNNRRDYKIDLVNKRRDNPLVAGSVTQRQLQVYSWVVIAWVVSALFLLGSFWTLTLSVLYGLLLLAYSHPAINIQARGMFAFVPLVICYGCIPALIGFGSFSLSVPQWVVLLLQPLLLLPMLLAKDYKDIKGDTKYGKKTFLVRHGPRATMCLATGLAVVLLAVLALIVARYGYTSYLLLGGCVYVVLIAYIHKKQAVIHREIKRLGFMLILAMTVLVLKNG